jgi:hypothetical protein
MFFFLDGVYYIKKKPKQNDDVSWCVFVVLWPAVYLAVE